MTQVRVHTAKIEARPIAYIVMTQTTMPVIYGTFATQDEAVSHAQKLEYADVLPVYEPTIH